jgi:protein tyrosine/serine phosphatase
MKNYIMNVKKRGFNVQCYTDAWKNVPEKLMNNYQPTNEDRKIIQERINEKLSK